MFRDHDSKQPNEATDPRAESNADKTRLALRILDVAEIVRIVILVVLLAIGLAATL